MRMQKQLFKVSQGHANRGRELEKLLERTHAYYRVHKKAVVDKNPVEWRYINFSQYNAAKDNVGASRTVAKTAHGEYLRKVKSDIDFSGTLAGGRSIYFDAKQTQGKSWPYDRIDKHQVETLIEKDKIGAIAGIILMFTDLDRAFFVQASTIDEGVINMLYRKGRKSLSIAECEQHALEIRVEKNSLGEATFIHWLQAVAPPQPKITGAVDHFG